MADRTLPGWPRGMSLTFAAAYVGLSESTLGALEKSGDFPAPTWLTPGRKVWLKDSLDRWIDVKAGIAAPAGAWPT